jgi:hypothetical protein
MSSFVKTKNIKDIGLEVRVMVFNATFNNISVISWQSVLLVVKTQLLCEFISDLRQIGGFPKVLWFSPPIKPTAMI